MLDQYYESKIPKYFHEKRPEMLNFIPEHSQIVLDVGCGSGLFGQSLKADRGIQVWGIELNPESAAEASQKLDKVINSPFGPNLALPGNMFDCIVFNDVLEHLTDPWAALTYSKELLSPGGVVVSSIPNVRYFNNIWELIIKKDWEYKEWGTLDKTHLRFFTQRSIRSLFEGLHYEIVLLTGITPIDVLHPQHARKFRILNRLLLNSIEDMNYMQFAVVARPRT